MKIRNIIVVKGNSIMPLTAKQNRRWKGKLAESLAALWLRGKGYRILARNSRRGGVEIDILAANGQTLCVVEVKFRQTMQAADLAISPEQRKRLQKQVRYWQQKAQVPQVRFDIVAVSPQWPFLRHHQGAVWVA